MTSRVRECLGGILPAVVTRFEVVDDYDHDNILVPSGCGHSPPTDGLPADQEIGGQPRFR